MKICGNRANLVLFASNLQNFCIKSSGSALHCRPERIRIALPHRPRGVGRRISLRLKSFHRPFCAHDMYSPNEFSTFVNDSCKKTSFPTNNAKKLHVFGLILLP